MSIITKKVLEVALANPRGFCAGVERAIDIVERLLEKYGPPIYVHNEIVHNKTVVSGLKSKGCIFITDVSSVPTGSYVVFSAHGVSEQVELDSERLGLKKIDATCPLVKKVHNEVINYSNQGMDIILIGHKNHPEVIGTMGRAAGIKLVETKLDAGNVDLFDNTVYVTQTTLSIDETSEIVGELKRGNKNILSPPASDICYATQNRQNATKQILKDGAEMLLVIGSKNSSNSNRLVEIGINMGISSYLIDGKDDIDIEWFSGIIEKIGITSGASAPDVIVKDVLSFLSSYFQLIVKEHVYISENISFKLPPEVR